jgi:hypothetical protein
MGFRRWINYQDLCAKVEDLCQMHGFDHMVFKKAKIEHGKFALSFEIISLGGVM